MPVLVTIQVPKGHEYSEILSSMQQVTDTLCHTLHEVPTNIRVTTREIPTNRYSVGGVLRYELEAKMKEEQKEHD